MSDEPLMIEVLKGIRTEIGGLRADTNRGFTELRAEVASTNARVDRLAEGMVRGFTAVHERIDGTNARLDELCEEQRRTNGRLDNLRDLSGDKWRDLDQRVGAIEQRLDRMAPTT